MPPPCCTGRKDGPPRDRRAFQKMAPDPGIPRSFYSDEWCQAPRPDSPGIVYSDEWLFFIACWAASGVQEPAIPHAGNVSFSLISLRLGGGKYLRLRSENLGTSEPPPLLLRPRSKGGGLAKIPSCFYITTWPPEARNGWLLSHKYTLWAGWVYVLDVSPSARSPVLLKSF